MKFTYENPELQEYSFGAFAGGVTTLPEGDSGEQVSMPNDDD